MRIGANFREEFASNYRFAFICVHSRILSSSPRTHVQLVLGQALLTLIYGGGLGSPLSEGVVEVEPLRSKGSDLWGKSTTSPSWYTETVSNPRDGGGRYGGGTPVT
jgi:hypothetical protein